MFSKVLPDDGITRVDGRIGALIGRWGWRGLWRDSHPDELAARLEACARTLAARTAETEPDFLALGGDLRSLYEAASELAQDIDKTTTRLHSVLTGNRFTGADGLVAATLDSVRTGIHSVDGEVKLLAAMMTGLAAMDPQLARFQRICLFLQSTAVGFAVESSRTAASQLAFGSFVDEIRGLSRRIAAVEEKVGRELTDARGEETARADELRGGLDAMGELARQLERTSSRAATEFQSGLDRMVALMAGTRERSALLRQHTEGAVYHVQFGDITRQKNEHIVAALLEVADTLRRAKRRSQVRVAALAADHTLAIQIGQMDVVCDELESAQRELSQAFARVAATAAEFVAPLRDHRAADAPHETNRLEMLTADFDQLLDLDGQSRDLRTRAAATADHAFATAERLAARMQEVESINRDMHLLALNATVKTAALESDGVTLEVLSRQIHDLYREADAAVTEVVALAARLRKREERTAEAAGPASPQDDAKRRLEVGVQQVRQSFQEFDQMAASALERAGRQDDWLAAATAKLGALQGFADQLRGLAGDLREMRAVLAPLCRAGKGDTTTAVDTDRHYTMQTERDVHRRVLAERAAAAGVETPPPEFDSAPSDRADSKPTPAEPQPAGESLGDNVELF